MFQKIGHYRQEHDLIGVALVVNQPQVLCYFLSKVSIVARYDEQPHWRPSATGIIDNLRDYEICTGPRYITYWFQLAIKFHSPECVEILSHNFLKAICRHLTREQKFRNREWKPLTNSINELLLCIIRSPPMFPLIETIEENLLPVLNMKIFDFELYYSSFKAGWELDRIFSILDESIQNLARITDSEDVHSSSQDIIQLCSSKPSLRILLGNTDKWKIWRRHLFRLYFCLDLLSQIL